MVKPVGDFPVEADDLSTSSSARQIRALFYCNILKKIATICAFNVDKAEIIGYNIDKFKNMPYQEWWRNLVL